MKSVYPSGAAFAAISAAMLPAAPGRLSVTICLPSASDTGCAIMRPRMSVGPPAGKGFSIRIGLGGDCCPCAGTAMQGMATELQRHIKRNSWLETDIRFLLLAAVHGFGEELFPGTG